MSLGLAALGTAPFAGPSPSGVAPFTPPGALSNTLLGPTGTPIPGVAATVRLSPHAGFRSDGTEVARQRTVISSATGTWTLDVTANSDITPAGTHYRVTQKMPDGTTTSWRVVATGVAQTVFGALI